nr:uncharacterized protein LOC129152979 isoform X2 [Nothobranchius furzeri]
MGVANRSEFSCLQVGAPGEQLLQIPSSARRGFKERCDNSPVLDDYSHWVLSSSACYQLFNLHSHQLLPGASGSPAHQPHRFSWPPALLRSPAHSWNRCSAPSLLHQLPLRPDTPSSPRSTTFLESVSLYSIAPSPFALHFSFLFSISERCQNRPPPTSPQPHQPQ